MPNVASWTTSSSVCPEPWSLTKSLIEPHPPGRGALRTLPRIRLFNAIQGIQNRVPIHGIDDLITVVQAAYKDMSADTLDNIFLTLKDCMRCILHQKGGNQYALPHFGKAKLRRKGILPRVLSCDQHLYDSAKAVLAESDHGSIAFFEPAE
ncbi:hypothetical protein PI125_g8844 [Phytophthora idaei]|nr:hypothetical protein PI125_g8844 [Phytophthora idaei]